MRAQFHVTYDIVTPESAEHGDTEDNGFVDAMGLHYSVDGIWGEPAENLGNDCAMSLREALNLVSPQEDSGNWFSEADGSEDFRTGANETRALHPPRNITGASYGRLARLLGVK